MKIHDMHPSLRPREHAEHLGIEILSDRELLAIVLRSGTKYQSVLEIADLIFERCGNITGLPKMTLHELIKINGIKKVKAIEVLAIIEIAKRMVEPRCGQIVEIHDTASIIKWLFIKIGFAKQEQFLVIYLNQNRCILNHQILFVGTVDRSLIHPRDIIREASIVGAMKVVFVHNHPSGTMSPSRSDIEATTVLIRACRLVGVEVYDHLIVSQSNYISLRFQLPELFIE